jgi:hypothetical protein
VAGLVAYSEERLSTSFLPGFSQAMHFAAISSWIMTGKWLLEKLRKYNTTKRLPYIRLSDLLFIYSLSDPGSI